MNEWISVKDRLPTPSYSKRFLAYGKPTCGTHSEEPTIEFCIYTEEDGFRFGEYDCGLDTTHWMSLPEPPK